MRKTFPDCTVLHAGKPKPQKRLFALRLLVDQPENQFSFASCVCCTDNAIHIRAVHQLLQDTKLLLGGRRHQILPLLRQDGQVCNAPLDVLGIVNIGRCQLHQMTNAPADEIAVALPITTLSIGRTENLCVSCPD